jgi:maltodextrin utilization protein YvdJ
MITYGAIKFNVFETREEIGSLMIILFSFASLIILLNLLIAILSNTFVIISKRSKLE